MAHRQVVLAANITDDALIQAQAADSSALRSYDVVHRQHCRFCDTAADVDDHAASWRTHRQASAKRRCQRLPYQLHFASAGRQDGLADRAFLDAGRAIGHSDHDGRTEQAQATRDAAKEILKHGFGDFVIGYDPVLQRTHNLNIFIIHAAQHFTRGVAEVDDALFFRQ